MTCRKTLSFSFTTIKLSVARKTHTCDYCKGEIKPGSQYVIVNKYGLVHKFHTKCFEQEHKHLNIKIQFTKNGLEICW